MSKLIKILFWLVYAVVYLALSAVGLVFTYWAGKFLYELL
jgi:hypothetical protein